MLLGGASERLRRSDILVKPPLKLVESNVASTIGGHLVDMGAPTLPVDTSSTHAEPLTTLATRRVGCRIPSRPHTHRVEHRRCYSQPNPGGGERVHLGLQCHR
jgi:hypothetical protein